MTFCAICTDDRGPFTMAPLGRNDAMVSVCIGCDTQRAVERRGPDRSYEPEPSGTWRDFRKAVNKASDRIGKAPLIQPGAVGSFTPGWKTVRVSRWDAMGKPRDRDDAMATLREQPWFDQVRHVGCSGRWHVFERPDVEGATKERNATLERGTEIKRWKADRR